MRLLFSLLIVSTLTPAPRTDAADQPATEPIEYVLQPDGDAIPRSELSEPFEENIEVRSEGERTNRWITRVKTASVTLYLPVGKPTVAVVICPGGAYLGHSFDNEGCRLAAWLAERGAAAGVLKYRTHTGKPLGDKPLRDAQAAVRFLREKTGLRVGVIGFSAGGHLTAMTANTPPKDLTDGEPWIAFHAMMYPVISMADEITHKFSRQLTLGPSPSEENKQRFSPYRLVSDKTPPAFLVHTADDSAVVCENSLVYFRACVDAGVDAELHVYPTGGHGWGMRGHQGTLNNWKQAFESWLVAKKMIKPRK